MDYLSVIRVQINGCLSLLSEVIHPYGFILFAYGDGGRTLLVALCVGNLYQLGRLEKRLIPCLHLFPRLIG